MTNSFHKSDKQVEIDPKVETLLNLYARVLRHINAGNGMIRAYTDLLSSYRRLKQDADVIIGVYGCPKMGKSTLLNTILGEAILPVGVIPTTGSVIDIKRREDKSDYELICTVGQSEKIPTLIHLPSVKDVRDYLTKHGSQQDPFDSIEISGPFPHAMSFVKSNYILRDTPGFERLSEGQVSSERLEEDTRKAIASLDEPDVYLFCVSAESPGCSGDLAMYDKYFRSRFCVHVMTHVEDIPDKSLIKLKNDFNQSFRLLPSDFDPKPLVCTGIRNRAESAGDSFLDIGRDALVEAVSKYLSPEDILTRILAICHFILAYPEKSGASSVPKVHLSALETHIINQF